MIFKISKTSFCDPLEKPHEKATRDKCKTCGREKGDWFIKIGVSGLVKFMETCGYPVILDLDSDGILMLTIVDERTDYGPDARKAS